MGYQCKPLLTLNGRTLLARTIDKLEQQGVEQWVVCANQRPEILQLGLPTIADANSHHGGPLPALLAALAWSHQQHPNSLLLTCPCDTPFLPDNLLPQLLTTWQLLKPECLVVTSHNKIHPTIGLWSSQLSDRLAQHLQTTTKASLLGWLQQCRHGILDFTQSDADPFFNINTPAELQLAKQPHFAPK